MSIRELLKVLLNESPPIHQRGRVKPPGDVIPFHTQSPDDIPSKEDAEFVQQENFKVLTGRGVPDWIEY